MSPSNVNRRESRGGVAIWHGARDFDPVPEFAGLKFRVIIIVTIIIVVIVNIVIVIVIVIIVIVLVIMFRALGRNPAPARAPARFSTQDIW